MDSFTISVVIGGGVVLLVLAGMFLIDRGAPERPTDSKSAKK